MARPVPANKKRLCNRGEQKSISERTTGGAARSKENVARGSMKVCRLE